jgi:hypothetical protein
MRITTSRPIAIAAALGSVAIATAGTGIATAANGGSLILGHRNHSGTTTTLATHHGVPLALRGPKSAAPLRVSSHHKVAHLNASLLDGKTATALATSGSGAQIDPHAYPHGLALTTQVHFATAVAATAKLKAGSYAVTATAVTRGGGSFGVTCIVGTGTDPDDAYSQSINNSGDWEPQAQTLLATLAKPGKLIESCESGDSSGLLYEAGITAIRVAHANAGSALKP